MAKKKPFVPFSVRLKISTRKGLKTLANKSSVHNDQEYARQILDEAVKQKRIL